MSSNASVPRVAVKWTLVKDCLLRFEASSDDGRYHFSLHQLHSVFRDGDASSTSENTEHLQHPEIPKVEPTALYARCATADGTFYDHKMPLQIEFLQSMQAFDEGLQVKVQGLGGVFKTLDRLPVPKMGSLLEENWLIVCADVYALLIRAEPAQPHTKVSYVNLNRCLGNTDGQFDSRSSGFLSTSRNVRLDGLELSADLRNRRGEWKACSLNVKELVQLRLMFGDPDFAPFDDLRVFPNHGPPMAVQKTLRSPETPLYNNLSREKRQIRLCRILPGEWNDPIEVCLITREDESSQAYECLSYVWGSQSDITQILVDGRVFGATANLCSALQQLRFRSNDKPIWIDAICINQQDNLEKSWQVAMMGDIYGRADNVVAYFGSIESLHQRVDEHSPVTDILSLEVVCRQIDDDTHFMYIPGLFGLTAEGTLVEGPQLRNIVSWFRGIKAHPWWSRVWTLQELIIPDNLTCLFGPLEIEWSTLSSAAYNIRTQSHACEDCKRAFRLLGPEILDVVQSWSDTIVLLERCRQIPRATHLRNPDRWNEALTLFSQVQRRDCFDERDKVFGLLAMLPPSPDAAPVLVPNYEASVERVYIDFTLHLIAASGSLMVWNLVSGEPSSATGGDTFPSWAVDWRVRKSSPGFGLVEMARSFNFTFPFAAPVPLPLEILDDRKSLVVEGAKVDILQTVSMSVWPTTALDSRAEFARVLKEWKAMVGSLARREYVLGGEVWDAFWRTLFYDHVWSLTEASGEPGFVRAKDENKKAWEEWSAMVLGEPKHEESLTESIDMQITSSPPVDSNQLLTYAAGRRLFITKNGFIGIGPAGGQPGDGCFALKSGTQWLYLLRPSPAGGNREHRAGGETVSLVGPAYVHGMMDERRDELLQNVTRIYVV